MGRRHQRALIDSGASCFVVPDATLLDEASADVFLDPDAIPDLLAPLETAGSEVPVEREAVLFAKIHSDSSDPETTTIIRVRTFVAPKLQTDVLLPVTGLADEVTFRAPRAGTSQPTARLRIMDVDGNEHYLSSTSEGGVFPVSLEPLTKQEVERYRALFPPETSTTATFAVVPRDTLCRGEDSEDTKQNAATLGRRAARLRSPPRKPPR